METVVLTSGRRTCSAQGINGLRPPYWWPRRDDEKLISDLKLARSNAIASSKEDAWVRQWDDHRLRREDRMAEPATHADPLCFPSIPKLPWTFYQQWQTRCSSTRSTSPSRQYQVPPLQRELHRHDNIIKANWEVVIRSRKAAKVCQLHGDKPTLSRPFRTRSRLRSKSSQGRKSSTPKPSDQDWECKYHFRSGDKAKRCASPCCRKKKSTEN